MPLDFTISGDFTAQDETAYILFYSRDELARAFGNPIPKADIPNQRSALSNFLFGTSQRTLLSLSFLVGAFVLIKKLFMHPQK